MVLRVLDNPEALARAAASHWLERVAARADLVMAAPAGRTPKLTYECLREESERRRVSLARTRVFAVDELCAPAPADGYFWRHVREGLLGWAGIPDANCHRFDPDAADLDGMCGAIEQRIAEVDGLDLVVLGLGPNGHLASNEPGSRFDTRTRPVRLLPETVAYILTASDADPRVTDRAVTLGLGTIADAHEVLMLVTGAGKRERLRHALTGPITPKCPASMLQRHPSAVVFADRAAAGSL